MSKQTQQLRVQPNDNVTGAGSFCQMIMLPDEVVPPNDNVTLMLSPFVEIKWCRQRLVHVLGVAGDCPGYSEQGLQIGVDLTSQPAWVECVALLVQAGLVRGEECTRGAEAIEWRLGLVEPAMVTQSAIGLAVDGLLG